MKHLKAFQQFESKINKLYELGIFEMEYDVDDEVGLSRNDFETYKIGDIFVKSVVGTYHEFDSELDIELSDGALVSFSLSLDDGPVKNFDYDKVFFEHYLNSNRKKVEIDSDYYLNEILSNWSGGALMVTIHKLFYPNLVLTHNGEKVNDEKPFDTSKIKIH